MFFKNARIFRIKSDLPLSFDIVETKLSKRTFTPCGAIEWLRSGWVPPTGINYSPLVHSVHGQWLVTLLTEEKILPASVIKKQLDERVAALHEAQGHAPGKRAIKELKLKVIDELLPKAFTRLRPTHAWIDPRNGWVVVDSSSDTKAEALISVLIQSLDNLPMTKLITRLTPTGSMKTCLEHGEGPVEFTIDRDCELKGVGNDGEPSVKFTHHALDGEDVRIHLENGKLPTKLGMTWNDRVSFVLTNKLGLNKLSFLNIQDSGTGNSEEAFDADFAIVTGELSGLMANLMGWLGGEQVEDQDEANADQDLAETEA